MTKKQPKHYALTDSPFYKLPSKKKLAELLHTSIDAMNALLAIQAKMEAQKR